MQQYQELIQTVIDTGSLQDNRTCIRTLSVPGAMMRFDLTKGGVGTFSAASESLDFLLAATQRQREKPGDGLIGSIIA